MADHQESTSHQQCQNENNDETEVHPIVENHDCLEHIFMRMDIETLLSVAHSSKLFQTLAASVFERKYGNTIVWLICSKFCVAFWTTAEDIKSIGDTRLKMVLPLLRVFGAKIAKLRLHYHSYQFGTSTLDNAKRRSMESMMRKIDEYINMYCADTLIRFDIRCKLKFSFDFPKPFKKIERVSVHGTHLYDNLLDFVDWFPNLQHFETNADCIDRRFNNVTLPHLKHLTVLFGDFPYRTYVGEQMVQLKNAGELLKANQQLHTVELHLHFFDCEYFTFKNLLDLITDNPRLLKIVFGVQAHANQCIRAIDSDEVNRIVNEHSGLIELKINNDHEIGADDAITMVRGLNSLKKFRFNINEFEYKGFIDQLTSDWEHSTSGLSNDGRKHYVVDLHRN